MQLNFEWDQEKAALNKRKHKISLERAATVFKDPKALTVFDEEHSDLEDRWITLGIDQNGVLLIVCHAYKKEDENMSSIRIFSSRKATKMEIKQYLGE